MTAAETTLTVRPNFPSSTASSCNDFPFLPVACRSIPHSPVSGPP
jgi:hypothetical protein